MSVGWKRCEVPQLNGRRGCWKLVLAEFDASGDDCWRREFDSSKRAQNAAVAMRASAAGMVERGEIKPVRISRYGNNVYMIAEGSISVRA